MSVRDEIIDLVDNWKDKHGKTDEDIERLIDSVTEDEIFIPNDEICSEIECGGSILWAILTYYENRNFGELLYPNTLISHYYLDGNDVNMMFVDRLYHKENMSEEDQISIFGEAVTEEDIDIGMTYGWLEMMVSDFEYEYTTAEYKELCEEVLIPVLKKCVDIYSKAFDDFDYILDRLIEKKREYERSEEGLKRIALGLGISFVEDGLSIDNFTINSDGELDFYNNGEFYRDILNTREKEKEHER